MLAQESINWTPVFSVLMSMPSGKTDQTDAINLVYTGQADRYLIFTQCHLTSHNILSIEVSTTQSNKALSKWIRN